MNEHNGGHERDEGICGPGCNCSTGGAVSRTKWIVCGIVALMAIVTVAAHLSRSRAANDRTRQDYSTAIPVVAPAEAVRPTVETDGWGASLKALAELNLVATNTDGVFVVLPSSDTARMAAVQKEVAAAAATIAARGPRMGMFLLDKDAREFAVLAQQVGTPAVLAMCKGRGMAAVKDKDVTQDALLKAFVGASRPSGCGPSGCGPGASGCN